METPTAGPGHERREEPDREGNQPEHGLEAAVHEAGNGDQRRADDRRRRDAEDRQEEIGIATRGKCVERQLHQRHDQEGDAEDDTVTPNASGTARAPTNMAPLATSIVPQTRPSPGSTVFVSHAYAAHAHQSAVRSRRACSRPLQVGLLDSTVVTCVNAKTKTRSKKSSSGETRCSRSTGFALTSER